MKWTKFKDGLPSNPIIFETDFKAIWTSSRAQYYGGAAGCVFDWSGYASSYPDHAWAEIPIPGVPKDLHSCSNAFSMNECLEYENGSFYMIQHSLSGKSLSSKVNFCPICGEASKEKKRDLFEQMKQAMDKCK